MNNSQVRILVAEDEIALRELLVTILADEEYKFDVATNGKEAWDLMNKNHYDLLMTDLYMPEMNGIELIQKGQASFPSTKIILFSGGAKELEAEHGKGEIKFCGVEIKIDLFLKKPCALNEMLSSIERILQV